MFATKTDPFSTKRMKCLQQLKGQATVEGWCAHQILNNDPRSKRKFLKFFILLSAKHCQIPATGLQEVASFQWIHIRKFWILILGGFLPLDWPALAATSQLDLEQGLNMSSQRW
jgi:hypothetical protein